MENEIELFVPGRLCLLGEHSDWAGKYRNVNNEINKGFALVTGIEEGIYASAKPSKKLIIRNKEDESKYFECEMSLNELQKVAEEGGYWSYIAGVASVIKEQYNVEGIEVEIEKVDIPEKKGLSSSAAICVLIAKAFNQIYNLHLNTIGEMNIAYLGEISTPSRCGRLDQACAFGKRPVLMTFDGDRLGVESVKVGDDFHFVFADLNAKKDTIKILADLNKCFPFAETELEKNVQYALGKKNQEFVFRGLDYLRKGDAESFGKLMNEYQENFDKMVAPACTKELTSPVLHKTMRDENIQDLIYGTKGVGSQGDGTIQFLAKDKESQEKLKSYLQDELGMQAYGLTINKTKAITKAIIPLAGNGTRMYPITKLLKKAFIPIVDSDNIVKPFIMILLEELDKAGIEEICLVIDKEDQKDYDKFFKEPLTPEVAAKLSPELLEYESKIQRIGRKLQYVYQEEKLGFGHAVSLCEKFADGENVLLALGDQLYLTDNNKSCTTQLLENFEKTGLLTVSVCPVSLEDISRYGILSGCINGKDNYYVVDKMYEKPEKEYAKEYLYTRRGNEKLFFSVLGEYIITPSVFDKLNDNISNHKTENGEYELTSVLDYVRSQEGMVAFIADGEMLDIGNVESYKKTLVRKMK